MRDPLSPPPAPPSGAAPCADESGDAARDLLRAFAAGDPTAVSTVYRQHADLVARVVAHFGAGGAADVEDVVQVTFLEAVRSASRFKGQTSLRGWLVSIALNQTRMHRRREGRLRKRMILFGAEEQAQSAVDEVHMADEDVARLRAALAKLPELQREAIVLCEIEGLPAKEVSALLGAPAATIWRRVHDAKKSLRRLLATEEEP